MTQLERLKLRIPEEQNDAVLEERLETAKEIIMSIRFYDNDWPDELERQYLGLQIDIAEDIYNRIGASGQTGHTENAVSRQWGSEWVSEQLLRRITPLAKAVWVL